ncbi:SAM-dependent methyltransferase [Lentzea guizhouensis]|uniref:SAM-dependent methyltransferase n=1 Tax=Lentzea guizhouensis TaxID=1586287 RepID=UPI000A91B128
MRELIDFDRPVGLLVVALLHFIPDSDTPAKIIAGFRDALPRGSYLVLSHFSSEGDPEQVEGLQRLSKGTPTPLTLRSRAAIATLLDGFDLVEPGLVYLPQWRPDPGDEAEENPEWFNDFCAVGRKA